VGVLFGLDCLQLCSTFILRLLKIRLNGSSTTNFAVEHGDRKQGVEKGTIFCVDFTCLLGRYQAARRYSHRDEVKNQRTRVGK
jgi:hypothetical protein